MGLYFSSYQSIIQWSFVWIVDSHQVLLCCGHLEILICTPNVASVKDHPIKEYSSKVLFTWFRGSKEGKKKEEGFTSFFSLAPMLNFALHQWPYWVPYGYKRHTLQRTIHWLFIPYKISSHYKVVYKQYLLKLYDSANKIVLLIGSRSTMLHFGL